MKLRQLTILGPWAAWCACAPAAGLDETTARTFAAMRHRKAQIAVIGDYGIDSHGERAVARLVRGWQPDWVVTTGDNNYPDGAPDSLDANVGKYYAAFIGDYRGAFGPGSAHNRFYPVLGNHDWHASLGAEPYLDYFSLPGNGRYYDVLLGSLHLFCLDSDPHEPDGIDSDAAQADWLRAGLAASNARWKVVVMHHPPLSSGKKGGAARLRWPFGAWGANLVLAGHHHVYERLAQDGLTYVVNGLGGAPIAKVKSKAAEASIVRYNDDFGALRLWTEGQRLMGEFVDVEGDSVDEFVID